MASKIYYIDATKVCKSARKREAVRAGYLMADVVERLRFGKVSIDTYWFDIPCAYAPVSRIGHDIVEADGIRELNWKTLFSDFLTDGRIAYDTKFIVWNFLRWQYPLNSYYETFGSHRLIVELGGDVIGSFDERELPEWCNGQSILYEIDIACGKLISLGCDTPFVIRLCDVLRLPVMSKTLETCLIEREVIDKDGIVLKKELKEGKSLVISL